MMKLLVLACLVAATIADEAFLTLDYHESFGVAEAQRVMEAEAAGVAVGRIAGGAASPIGTEPYLAGIIINLTTGATSICAGSLLSNTRVVTAAHCWWDGFTQARNFTVVLGSTLLSTGGTRRTTSDVEMHASWNPWSTNNNIAMVVIDSVNYSDVIRPIALPTGVVVQYVGQWAVASGYGSTGEYAAVPAPGSSAYNSKSTVVLQVMSNLACQEFYGTWKVVTSTLCTTGIGRVGICGGDAGAPLAIGNGDNRVLIGIGSFSTHRGCQLGLPSGFTRVTSYITWINTRL